MIEKKNQQLTKEDIEKMLSRQTEVILDAVSEKTTGLEKSMVGIEGGVGGLKRDIEEMEYRINQKIDRLVTTLDGFLKRLTDTEDEFTIMKADINRMKKVIKEKLGVDLV